MSCITLYKGQDSTCQTYANKYFQQAVLINKKHVKAFEVNRGVGTDISFPDEISKNNIRFQLLEGERGILFRGNERGDSFNAMWSMEREDYIPQYIHEVQLPIFGVKESTKVILKSLDESEYFAAVQYRDGTVEIFGFDNGLKTDSYDFEPQGNGGGSIIELISSENGMEDDPPYVYVPIGDNTATEDFDNLFEDIDDILLGSFNDDFNDDFDIT